MVCDEDDDGTLYLEKNSSNAQYCGESFQEGIESDKDKACWVETTLVT